MRNIKTFRFTGLIIALFLPVLLKSQPNFKPGEICFENGDTLRCMIKYQPAGRMHTGIIYINQKGKETKTSPERVKWYSRDTVYYYKFRKISSTRFYKQINTGKVNLFVYDSAPSSGGVGGGGYHYNAATGGYYYGGASFGSMYSGTTTSTYVIVGENNPEPIKITKNNFKKKMMACFGSDNQILKNYLNYGISGIEAFVNEYNNGK